MPARGQPSYIEYDASSLDVSLVDELEDFAHPAPHKGLVTTSTQESSLRPFLVPGTRARQPSCKNIAYVVEREPTTCKLPSTIVSDGREIRRYDYMCSHKDMTQAETYRAPRPPAAVTLTRPEIHSSQLIHEHLIKQNEVDFSKWLSQGNAIKSRLKHKPVKVWPLLNPTHIPYQRSQSFLIKPLSIKPHDLSYFFLPKRQSRYSDLAQISNEIDNLYRPRAELLESAKSTAVSSSAIKSRSSVSEINLTADISASTKAKQKRERIQQQISQGSGRVAPRYPPYNSEFRSYLRVLDTSQNLFK